MINCDSYEYGLHTMELYNSDTCTELFESHISHLNPMYIGHKYGSIKLDYHSL